MNNQDMNDTPKKKGCCSGESSAGENKRLSEKKAIEKLRFLEGWVILEDQGIARLNKTFRLREFSQGVALLNKINSLTEKFNHHPAIELQFKSMTISWHTHSVKGLTDLDFASAEACDALYKEL